MRSPIALLFAVPSTAMLLATSARADPPRIEFGGSTGLGVLAAGINPGRFAMSPSASFMVRGDGAFFVVRDTAALLGANGGGFGINNELTLGGGYAWKLVNASAGLSLSGYSLPICGPRLCGQVSGIAPGASARIDIFGPFLAGAIGVAADCSATWIAGSAAPVWSGLSVRCSAGPILRFSSRR